MNKSRRLFALTARALAAAGVAVLFVDLFGTGDSAGEFQDASWSIWQADVCAARQWLEAEAPDAAPAVLAVRTGALFLADASLVDGAHVVLWQPVVEGAVFLQQFLRLRSVASKFAGRNEPVSELKKRVLGGEAIEVAGYMISPAIARGLAEGQLAAESLRPARAVDVFEFKQGGVSLTPKLMAWADALNDLGCSVGTTVCDIAPFWSSQEIAAPGAVVDEARKAILSR